MRPNQRMMRPLLAISCLTLVGCGDGLSKGSLADIINQQRLQDYDPICWTVDRKPAQLPLTIALSEPPERDPILGGLSRAGFITTTMGRQGFFGAEWNIGLTDAGRSAGVWDENKGFCVGQRRVHEVIRWTEPTQGQATSFIEVTYTWQLGERPKWVKPEMFPEVEGMTEPVESSITLVKTTDGWRAD